MVHLVHVGGALTRVHGRARLHQSLRAAAVVAPVANTLSPGLVEGQQPTRGNPTGTSASGTVRVSPCSGAVRCRWAPRIAKNIHLLSRWWGRRPGQIQRAAALYAADGQAARHVPVEGDRVTLLDHLLLQRPLLHGLGRLGGLSLGIVLPCTCAAPTVRLVSVRAARLGI